MERSSVVRITTAFVAGLVVALVSALVYVRIHEGQTVQRASIALAEKPERQELPLPEPEDKVAAPASPTVKEPRALKDESSLDLTPPVQRALPAKPKVTRRAVSQPHSPVQVVENTVPKNSGPGGPGPAYPQVSQPPASEPVKSASPSSSETAAAAPPAPAPPHVVELAAGTNLSVRLGETLSTEHNYAGDTFRGTLEQPIIRNGFVIAERGSKVLGRVAESDKAGRMRGVANLHLTLTEINTTDGQRIEVQTNSVEKRGTASTGSDTAKIAGGAALGAIIGALGGGGKGAAIGAGAGGAAGTGVVLATRGRPAVMPSESMLSFELASPVMITEQIRR